MSMVPVGCVFSALVRVVAECGAEEACSPGVPASDVFHRVTFTRFPLDPSMPGLYLEVFFPVCLCDLRIVVEF